MVQKGRNESLAPKPSGSDPNHSSFEKKKRKESTILHSLYKDANITILLLHSLRAVTYGFLYLCVLSSTCTTLSPQYLNISPCAFTLQHSHLQAIVTWPSHWVVPKHCHFFLSSMSKMGVKYARGS